MIPGGKIYKFIRFLLFFAFNPFAIVGLFGFQDRSITVGLSPFCLSSWKKSIRQWLSNVFVQLTPLKFVSWVQSFYSAVKRRLYARSQERLDIP